MSYQFPKTIFVDQPMSDNHQFNHVVSEVIEIAEAKTPEHKIEECYDAIHSLETLIRKIVKHQHSLGNMVNPSSIRLEVIEKNKKRGYYE